MGRFKQFRSRELGPAFAGLETVRRSPDYANGDALAIEAAAGLAIVAAMHSHKARGGSVPKSTQRYWHAEGVRQAETLDSVGFSSSAMARAASVIEVMTAPSLVEAPSQESEL